LTKHTLYTGFLFLLLVFVFGNPACGQTDTLSRRVPVDSLNKVATPVQNKAKVDSVIRLHSPKKAAIRSALVPGLGQIYNKRYWKLPIVYGGLGLTGGLFIYNLQSYREFRQAYQVRVAYGRNPQDPVNLANYNSLEQIYKVLDPEVIRLYRDDARRNVDYSALFFILFWGLQVVDAAVDAHLKSFDVSPDLSFRFKFGHSQMAGTTGFSLVLAFK
jgi:hypothetical protein